MTRDERWQRLTSEHWDILIIGCGITGAGAARDAARRGLKVACVDMHDIAFGTSSRSSKLIHGGLRYLENYEFSLVFEAVSERKTLQDIAPHLVNPLGFMFPIYTTSRVGVNTLRAGLWVYDGLSMFRSPKLHRTYSPSQATEAEPLLEGKGLKGAPLYYDCATDDARLTLETIIDAHLHGACVMTYTPVTGLVQDDSGHVEGVRVRDLIGNRTAQIRAKAVVNATGPWTDRTRGMGAGGRKLLSPTKGVHIVVPGDRLPLRWAVVCNHPVDKRVLFAIPWGEETYIGTTDTFYEGDPAEVAADSADIDYLLDAANAYFPSTKLVREDVISTWAGLRPLIREDGAAEGAVSREHEIVLGPDLLITIAGGKLTTYRRMGKEVVRKALEVIKLTTGQLPHMRDPKTGRDPLPGAVGWPEDDNAGRIAALIRDKAPPLSEATAQHLANRYGTRGIDIAELCMTNQRLLEPLVPGRPEVLGLVDWAVKDELAERVADVMTRRTQLYFRDRDQGLGAVEKVAARMAELLGWDAERRTQEVLNYQSEVGRSRAWRSE
jgi:glycerol-3-phosphate dehydrogenase